VPRDHKHTGSRSTPALPSALLETSTRSSWPCDLTFYCARSLAGFAPCCHYHDHCVLLIIPGRSKHMVVGHPRCVMRVFVWMISFHTRQTSWTTTQLYSSPSLLNTQGMFGSWVFLESRTHETPASIFRVYSTTRPLSQSREEEGL
jgi:hypothetical protein